MRPCTCDKDECRLCYLYRNDERYRELWSKPSLATVRPTTITDTGRCSYLQGETGKSILCPSCRGNVKVKVLRCAVYRECTVSKKIDNIPCCNGCPKYTPIPNKLRTLKWACGVTTVPSRRNTTLERTLQSIEDAGFTKPRLFIDDTENTSSWKSLGLEITSHYPRLRTYGTYALALHELFIRNGDADRFVIFQDDMILCRNVREYLERSEYPNKGYLNLYTTSLSGIASNRAAKLGWQHSGQNGIGALALVFNRDAVVTLLTGRHWIERPILRSAKEINVWWRKIDGGIVDTMRKAGYKEYVHYPSLVEHIGSESTIRPNNPARFKPHDLAKVKSFMYSNSFQGESFDALSMFTATSSTNFLLK